MLDSYTLHPESCILNRDWGQQCIVLRFHGLLVLGCETQEIIHTNRHGWFSKFGSFFYPGGVLSLRPKEGP